MSSCVNRVVLIGNLGADPDTRFTPSATQVVTANLATDDSWTDRHGKEHQQTEWHRLVFWRRLAEIATDYLHKGSRIHIEGRLKSRTWEDDDGNRHFLTEIVVSDLQILDGSGNGPAELDLLYGRDQLHGSEQATIALASTALASTAGAQYRDPNRCGRSRCRYLCLRHLCRRGFRHWGFCNRRDRHRGDYRRRDSHREACYRGAWHHRLVHRRVWRGGRGRSAFLNLALLCWPSCSGHAEGEVC